MIFLIFVIGIITDLILLGVYLYLYKQNVELGHIRTFIFAALGVDSLIYIFSVRSLRRGILHINPFSNRFLVFSVIIGFVLQLSAIYYGPFQKLLDTVPLNRIDWLWIGVLSVIEILLIEITKKIFNPHKKHAGKKDRK